METLRLDTHFSSAAPDAAGPQGAGRGAAIPALVYSMHSFTIARPATTLQREEEKLVEKVVVSSACSERYPWNNVSEGREDASGRGGEGL